MTYQASRTYQRSLWGRGQQQATRSGYGATRFQPRWPVGSCRNSLPRSTHSYSGAADPLKLCLGSPALPQHHQACHQAWAPQPSLSVLGPATRPCPGLSGMPGPGKQWGEPPALPGSPTFTAIGGDLSKRVVAAVTLASNDTRLARTLAVLRVTDSGQGARGVAVTQEAGGAASGPVVVLLGGRRGMGSLAQALFPGLSAVSPLDRGSLTSSLPKSGSQNT